MDETISFFNALFGGYRELGFIELRSLSPRPDGRKDSRSFFYESVDDVMTALRWAKAGAETLVGDIYFGVLPRTRKDSHKAAVSQARVLWVDIDAKEVSKEDCRRGLFTGGVPSPSYVIDSGGGFHAYWLLEQSTCSVSDIEDACYGLARGVGGDSCHNADRILRVPGTFNYKDSENPRPVTILQNTGLVYPYSAFERFRLVGADYRLATPLMDEISPEPVALEELYEVLPDFLVEYIQHGLAADIHDSFGSDRSRLDFYIISKLFKNGFSANQIAGIFLDPEYAISSKTLSKFGKARERYLGNSINRAKAVVEDERVGELV